MNRIWLLESAAMSKLDRELRTANLANFATAASPVSAGFTVSKNRPGVAEISVRGVMLAGEGMLDRMIAALFGATLTPSVTRAVTAAAEDPGIHTILLNVDSPGGMSGGIPDLAGAVRDAAARKRVVAHVTDVAASAAYWAVSGASMVVAGPAAEVGSIGAFMVMQDESEAAKAAGIRVHVISSAPPLKGAGVRGSEVTSLQLGEWQRRIDDLVAVFVSEVAVGRRLPTSAVLASADGGVWIAAEACRRGLIDAVMSPKEVGREIDRAGGRTGRRTTVLDGSPAPAAVADPKEVTSMPQKPPTIAATPPPSTPEVRMRRTKAEVFQEARKRAVAGFPRRTPEAALNAFWATEAGRDLYSEYQEAPETAIEAVEAVGSDLASLRAAAVAEERLAGPGPDAIHDRIEREAGAQGSVGDRAVAVARFVRTPAGGALYADYSRARATRYAMRTRYAQALITAELEPIAAALRAEGMTPEAAALEAITHTPRLYAVRQRLEGEAMRGASVSQLEEGHLERVEMVADLATAARDHQERLASAEFEPEAISFSQALKEAIA